MHLQTAPDSVLTVATPDRLNLHNNLNIFGNVFFARNSSLLGQSTHDAPNAGTFVLSRLHNPHQVTLHNVINVARFYHPAIISPVVWNAGPDEGKRRTSLHHLLLGVELLNGVPSYLNAWIWNAIIVAHSTGKPR
jgi:hypothetical protein